MRQPSADPNPVARRRALLLALALAAPAAHALESDSRQPIELEADRAELDDRSGIGVYRGGVVVVRGSLRLTADELTLIRGDDGDRMVADGKPATYRVQPDSGAEVRGRANHIEHFGDQQQMILIGDAELVQGGDTFRGERIVYDIAANRVTADAGSQSGSGRVRIVIQPRETGQ